ncbi:MAG: hypothetical protein H7099_01140 [Gemmatimonadaceae bacterium]|nr:hypothetical protein [Gemmatimonadaceae bacterium]
MTPFADPLVLFRVAVERMNAEDFLGAAQCCDPVSLRAFHRQTVSRFADSGARRTPQLEDFMHGDPDMPRELAEYNLRKHHEAMHRFGDVSREFPGITDLDALRAAEPERLFASCLEGQSIGWRLARHVADGEMSAADVGVSELLNAFRGRLRSIGVIEISPSLAHIFYAHDVLAPEAPADPWAAKELARIASLPADEQALYADVRGNHSPRSTSCRRQPSGGWLLIAGHEFPGLSTGLVIGRAGPGDDEEDLRSEP